MSLLGRIGNIFRNDVAKPVQRNVVQPIQHATQQPRVDVQKLAAALQIIHPNAPPAVHASIIHNLTHNPVTNTAGGLAKGTAQWAAAAPKSLYGDVRVAAADASHNPQARKNALKARNQAETTFASPILRPVVQGIETLAHPFTQHTVTPTSNDAKRLLGDTPIQNINKGVASNYDAHKNLNPVARAALAALYGGGQIAQDVGTVAGLRSGIKPAVSAAENAKPLNEVGAVGKDVNKNKGSIAPTENLTLYHGTKAKVDNANQLDPLSYGDPQALYGPGTYLTDSENIAKGYAKTKGAGEEGQVLSTSLKPGTKLLNLESKLSPEDAKIFNKHASPDIIHFIGKDKVIIPGEDITSDMTGKEAVKAIQERLNGNEISKAEAHQEFLQLQEVLQKKGYRGFSHIGGADKTPHNVKILFNPKEDLQAVAQSAQVANSPALTKDSPKTPPTPSKQVKVAGQGSEQIPNTHSYLQQQIKEQEAARKLGNPTGLGKIKPHLSDAKTKLIDSLAPIEDTLGQKVTAKNAATHITPQLDRVLRADTIGAQYIKDKGLAKVIQSVPSTKELDQYLIAKHASDLEKNGIETGRNLAADKQLVEHLAPHYEAHAQALKQYSEGLLDTAQNYGLISKDLATHLKEKYPNYVPVHRIFSDAEIQGPPKGVGGGKASIGSQSIVQRIKGSERTIESPLSSLIDKSIQVAKEGERNKAAQILTGYRDLPGNPYQLRELTKNETVGEKPVISVLENGETRRFETTPEIATAAKSLNKEQLGLVGQVLAAPTRVLRLGATGLNPAFALANVTKDSVSAFINSSHPLRASVANPKVFVQSLKAAINHSSGEYGELVREGAGGTSFDIARNAPKQNVRAIRMQKNAGSKVLYTVTKPSQLFRAAENAIGRSEEFNRALQYYGNKQAALKGGSALEEAQAYGAHAARNNTVNFARAGDFGRVANSVLPYLNAGVQGSRTLIRNLKERPAQTAAKLAVTAFFPTAVVTAWNTSDPERKAAYDDIKQYEKQGNLIIVPPHPVKDKNGKWNVIKIPVSQEIANLNDIVRNGVETAVGDGSIKLADVLGNAAGTVTSLNAQSPRQLVGQLTPQAVKPGIEALTNKNLFTGNQIVPDSQKNLPGRDQVGPGTSGTATELGKALGISPRQIDNFIQTAGGGLGQNIVNLTDQALNKTGAIKPDQVKGKSFGTSIKGRFEGAQGQSAYDIADTKFQGLSKQLQGLPGYKSMSPEDKAKALNRLQSQVSSTYVPKKNSDGSQKPLSVRQQDILGGKPNLDSYLSAQTGSTKTDYNKKPDAEYQTALKKYQQDKKAGSLSQAQDIKAQSNLTKLKVDSTFDKNIRDLYGLNKTDIYNFITTDKNGKSVANQLNKYDQALKDSGLITKLKFAKGFAVATSSSGSRKSSVAKVKLSPLPKAPKVKKLAVKKSKSTKLPFKKYALGGKKTVVKFKGA